MKIAFGLTGKTCRVLIDTSDEGNNTLLSHTFQTGGLSNQLTSISAPSQKFSNRRFPDRSADPSVWWRSDDRTPVRQLGPDFDIRVAQLVALHYVLFIVYSMTMAERESLTQYKESPIISHTVLLIVVVASVGSTPLSVNVVLWWTRSRSGECSLHTAVTQWASSLKDKGQQSYKEIKVLELETDNTTFCLVRFFII